MTITAENCYEILGISREANDEEVKQAFRELAKNYHPDRNPGDEEAERQFKRVNMAYDAVKDAGRRQAYNEWLAYSVGRQKTKRRQWGRLGALLVLLLLGPSAAISWIAFSGEGSIVELGKGQPETAATSETPPMPPSASGDPAQQDHTGSATAADNPVGAQAGANQEPDKALPPKPAVGTAPDGSTPVLPPKVDDKPNPGPAKGVSAQPPNEAPTVSGETPDAPSEDREPKHADQTPATPEYTDAIADAGDRNAAPAVADIQTGRPRRPLPDNKSDGARAAAHRLAELKEPGNAEAGGRTEAQPLSIIPHGRGPGGSSGDRKPSGPFADCEGCPLMSVARHASSSEQGESLAVSQSEINVKQWNACVRDHVCPPYGPAGGGDPSARVTGLSEHDAYAYAKWLSEITGEPYRIVMPLSQPAGHANGPVNADDNCDDRDPWRSKTGGWEWLEDQPARGCPPPSAAHAPGDKPHGFRVARRVKVDG